MYVDCFVSNKPKHFVAREIIHDSKYMVCVHYQKSICGTKQCQFAINLDDARLNTLSEFVIYDVNYVYQKGCMY